jgi:hypothetical protein
MLIRFSSVFSALVVCAAGLVALAPGTASAGPCGGRVCPGGDSVDVIARGNRTLPGGGGGSGGDVLGNAPTGPGLGCPNQGNGIGCAQGPPPAAGADPAPTIQIAGTARDQLNLPAPQIGTSPSPRSYVRMRTGLWVDPANFSVLRASATDPLGDQTVTATATPVNVTWKMVEGTVVCQGPGTPNTTQCGYTYQRSSAGQPTGKYRISASITWTVAWACEGADCESSGAPPLAPMTMTTSADLPVLEIQTESQPG